jgi:hypothetical protein
MTAFGEYGSANIFGRSLDDGIISQSINRIIAALQEHGYNPQDSGLSLGF